MSLKPAETSDGGDLTLHQFIKEVAALATPAEHVAIVGEAWETHALAKMMDAIITEARRQLKTLGFDGTGMGA